MGDDFTGGKMGGVAFNKYMAPLGLICGMALALGIPWMTLVYGQHLSGAVQATLIILGILAGGLVVSLAVFFGIVIPSKVGGMKGGCSDAMMKMGMEQKRRKADAAGSKQPTGDESTTKQETDSQTPSAGPNPPSPGPV